jgi:hypothetical protein
MAAQADAGRVAGDEAIVERDHRATLLDKKTSFGALGFDTALRWTKMPNDRNEKSC